MIGQISRFGTVKLLWNMNQEALEAPNPSPTVTPGERYKYTLCERCGQVQVVGWSQSMTVTCAECVHTNGHLALRPGEVCECGFQIGGRP